MYRQRQRPRGASGPGGSPRCPLRSSSRRSAPRCSPSSVGGAVFFSGGGAGPAPPRPHPAPTSTPLTPSPRPRWRPHECRLPRANPWPWTATVPAGWTSVGRVVVTPSHGTSGRRPGSRVSSSGADNVPRDPCDGRRPGDRRRVRRWTTRRGSRGARRPGRFEADRHHARRVPGTRVDVELPADLSACGERSNYIALRRGRQGAGSSRRGRRTRSPSGRSTSEGADDRHHRSSSFRPGSPRRRHGRGRADRRDSIAVTPLTAVASVQARGACA